MNIRAIQDRLIIAEQVMRELSEGRVGPAPLRAQQLPYLHEFSDMAGWGKKLNDKACKLLKEDKDEFALISQLFWEQYNRGPSPEEVSTAQRVLEWTRLVEDDGERRALLAWTRAMAGGMSFARWCKRIEHIHVETGRRRKNRAVEQILRQLPGKHDLHDESGPERVLPCGPEISDVSGTLADDANGRETGLGSWASDEAFQPLTFARINGTRQIEVEGDFSWARKRNERRRQQEAKRRKEAHEPV